MHSIYGQCIIIWAVHHVSASETCEKLITCLYYTVLNWKCKFTHRNGKHEDKIDDGSVKEYTVLRVH